MIWILLFALFITVGYIIRCSNDCLCEDNYLGFWICVITSIALAVFGVILFKAIKSDVEHNAIEKYIEGNIEIHDTVIDGEIVNRTYKILNDIDYD